MPSKSGKQRNRKTVPRQTRHFQLRRNHEGDKHVAEILDYAKSQRREVTLIRDAISLFWALENGDLEALFAAFPQYKAQLKPPAGGSGGGQSELAKEIAAQIILQGGTPGYVMQSALPPVTNAVTPAMPAAPKAVVKKAEVKISADEIADNMLSALDMFG